MTNQGVNAQEREGRKVIRLIRPSVVVLLGPAGCGKSTFAGRKFRPSQVVSSDQARLLVCDDERDQRFNQQAFALLHFLIEQRLGINRLCVVDSTALTPPARKALLELARRFRVPCDVLVLDAPLAACLERDAKRERSVGAAVIERQHQAFEQSKAGLAQEGFDRVITLRDDELEQVEFEIQFRPVARPGLDLPRPQPGRPIAPGKPAGFERRERRQPGPPRSPAAARPNALPRPAGPRPAPASASPPAARPPAGDAPPPSEPREAQNPEKATASSHAPEKPTTPEPES